MLSIFGVKMSDLYNICRTIFHFSIDKIKLKEIIEASWLHQVLSGLLELLSCLGLESCLKTTLWNSWACLGVNGQLDNYVLDLMFDMQCKQTQCVTLKSQNAHCPLFFPMHYISQKIYLSIIFRTSFLNLFPLFWHLCNITPIPTHWYAIWGYVWLYCELHFLEKDM